MHGDTENPLHIIVSSCKIFISIFWFTVMIIIGCTIVKLVTEGPHFYYDESNSSNNGFASGT